ncbi:MAG: hypothetical protein HC922_10800 [Leptolyngbyaceae cyanobacterium SM2_3_12]|nr:hypothetical protein [Leptolyngbyaceae cyanobacterium SM2_3_12]
MQPQPGRPAISLEPSISFSRTTNAVNALPQEELDTSLRILLVLGRDEAGATTPADQILQLPQEAQVLKDLLELSTSRLSQRGSQPVTCQVQTLVEPDLKTLAQTLEVGDFNVFFYAGHGVPAPDGGLLFLQQGVTLSGTELAQSLSRSGVRLAVFNTCWGANPISTSNR